MNSDMQFYAPINGKLEKVTVYFVDKEDRTTLITAINGKPLSRGTRNGYWHFGDIPVEISDLRVLHDGVFSPVSFDDFCSWWNNKFNHTLPESVSV